MSRQIESVVQDEREAAEGFVKELVRVVRSHRLYQGNHLNLEGMFEQISRKCDAAAARRPLVLTLTPTELHARGELLLSVSSEAEVVPGLLYDHGVVGLEFEAGMPESEARALIEILAAEPDPATDYPTLLWEADLRHVRVLLDADEDEEEPPSSPQQFARQVATMGDVDDPPVQPEYHEERNELRLRAAPEPPQLEGEQFELTEADHWQVGALLAGDGFAATARHAARVVHGMANEPMADDEQTAAAHSLRMLLFSLCGSGDLEGLMEIHTRGSRLAASGAEQKVRLGNAALDVLREPGTVARLTRGLDKRESVDSDALKKLIDHAGPTAIPALADWLTRSAHPAAAAQALAVFGSESVEALVPLYRTGPHEHRARIAPALLHLATPEALAVLADEFECLDDGERLRLIQMIEASADAGMRSLVVRALDDPARKVRRAALIAVNRDDAPHLARVLETRLRQGALDEIDKEELSAFFDMLARVGDAEVAQILISHCQPKRLRLARSRLTRVQQRCVRTLRRMRSEDARKAVEELREHGPRALREALEDPLGDLSS